MMNITDSLTTLYNRYACTEIDGVFIEVRIIYTFLKHLLKLKGEKITFPSDYKHISFGTRCDTHYKDFYSW
jgi:hypothetical protein